MDLRIRVLNDEDAEQELAKGQLLLKVVDPCRGGERYAVLEFCRIDRWWERVEDV